MPDIIIRLATKEDAELIADLSRETFFESYVDQNSKADMDKFLDVQFTRQKLIHEVDQPWHIFFLAFMDKQPVGYVKMKDGETPLSLAGQSCIEIARIYSVQQIIGKGVGRKLMETCLEFAKQKNKKIIWLAVWEKNQRAIRFYTKWGFEKFGRQEFTLGDDVQNDWLMKKNL